MNVLRKLLQLRTVRGVHGKIPFKKRAHMYVAKQKKGDVGGGGDPVSSLIGVSEVCGNYVYVNDVDDSVAV